MPTSARRPPLLSLIAAAVLAVIAPAASAGPVETVTGLADSGAGSLRQAVADVDAGGTIAFAPSLRGTITLTSGQIEIAKGMRIVGPGARELAVSGGDASRIFRVSAGDPVELEGLTLTDAYASGTALATGGAILKTGSGELVIRDSRIVDNVTEATEGLAVGGGISTDAGSLTLERVVLGRNRATGAVDARGGGLAVRFAAVGATLRNVTVADNAAEGPRTYGGGVDVLLGGLDVVFEHVTIAGNSAQTGGGLLTRSVARVVNSVIAGNTAAARPDCSTPDLGELDVVGMNVIEQVSDCTVNRSERVISGVDPRLGPLAFTSAGQTEAISPAADSVVLDAAPVAGDGACQPPSIDQRSVARPQGAACDLGALEARAQRAVFTPTLLDFGGVRVDHGSSKQTLALANDTDADLPLSTGALALGGGAAGAFTLDASTCPAALAPGASCDLTAAFAPSGAGPWSATVEAGDPTGASALLEGFGYVLGSSVQPASLAFGEQLAGTTSVPRAVTIHGTGGPLTIGAATVASEFAIVSDDCSGRTLALGESCRLAVAFAPASAGARSSTLTVDSDSGAPMEVALSGTGVVAQTPRRRPGSGSQQPEPEPPAPAISAPEVTQFALGARCVRRAGAGRVRVGLRLGLSRPAPVRIQVARAVGTRGMTRCPRVGSPGRFSGRFAVAATFTRGSGGMRAGAPGSASREHVLTMNLAPALYRITVRPHRGDGRLGPPRHRYLRVLAG